MLPLVHRAVWLREGFNMFDGIPNENVLLSLRLT